MKIGTREPDVEILRNFLLLRLMLLLLLLLLLSVEGSLPLPLRMNETFEDVLVADEEAQDVAQLRQRRMRIHDTRRIVIVVIVVVVVVVVVAVGDAISGENERLVLDQSR